MFAYPFLEQPPLVPRFLFELQCTPKGDGGAPDPGKTLCVTPLVLNLFVFLLEASQPERRAVLLQ